MASTVSQTRRAGWAAMVALAAVLAACTARDVSTTTYEFRDGSYSPRLVYGAARYDAVKLDVAGNPFDSSDAAFARAVHAAVSETSVAHPIPFTLDEPDPKSGYRMVVLANPAKGVGRDGVCRGARDHADPGDGGLELLMTYCLGSDPVSSLRTRRAGLTGADDPALRSMVQQGTLTLFPPVDETRQDGDFM